MPLNILTVPSPPGTPETSPASVFTALISMILPLLLFGAEEQAVSIKTVNRIPICFMAVLFCRF
jgi:hypothetical protein